MTYHAPAHDSRLNKSITGGAASWLFRGTVNPRPQFRARSFNRQGPVGSPLLAWTAAAYREFDRTGALAEMFGGAGVPDDLRGGAAREEAWILGLGHPALTVAARTGAVQ